MASADGFLIPPKTPTSFQQRCRPSIRSPAARNCWAAANWRRRAAVASAAGRDGGGGDGAETGRDAAVQLVAADIASTSTWTAAQRQTARGGSPCTVHSATREVASLEVGHDTQTPNELRLQQQHVTSV